MGEVIEFSIISDKEDIVEIVMCFMEEMFKLHNGILNIEAMDNWCYENVFTLNTLEEVKTYMHSHIIIVTKKLLNKQIGVSIEHFSECYCYDFWYNPQEELSADDCKNIYDMLVNFILNNLKDVVMMCGIGREIIINFSTDIDEIINGSHNIDIWVIKKSIYEKCRIKETIGASVILI